MKFVEANTVGLYTNLVPVADLAFAALFGGTVGVLQLAGGALAVAG